MGCREYARNWSSDTYLCGDCTALLLRQSRARFPRRSRLLLGRYCGNCKRYTVCWLWRSDTHLCRDCTRDLFTSNRRWVRDQENHR